MTSVLSSLERLFSELIASFFQTFWRERKSTRLFQPSSHRMKEVFESFHQRGMLPGEGDGGCARFSEHLEKQGKALLLQLELNFNELTVLPFTPLGCVTWVFLSVIK